MGRRYQTGEGIKRDGTVFFVQEAVKVAVNGKEEEERVVQKTP
jgi:hypothetical protein